MLEAKGLEAGAREEARWDGRDFDALGSADRSRYLGRFADGVTAYLEAVGGEPVASGMETCKFYHSQWPTEDLLKARGPYGLITDDGEAWRYRYTHSDGQGGIYDLVYRPATAPQAPAPATTTDERAVEALRAALEAMRHVFMVCPVPTAPDQKRAWGSLVDAIQSADAAIAQGESR